MATIIENKDGKKVVLLNPSEKGKKYVTEIKTGMKTTNDGFIKKDEFNRVIKLDKTERAYRAGYLDSQKDSAKCYNAREKKKGGKK